MSSQGWIAACVAVLAVAMALVSGRQATALDRSGHEPDVLWFDQQPSAECGCSRSPETWQVTASALFLHRRRPAAVDLIIDAIDGAPVLNARDFDLGVHPGFEVSMTRRIRGPLAIEARYFGIEQWHAAVARPTDQGSLLQMNFSPPFGVEAGTDIAASHRSELHNVEVNGLFRWTDRWTWLAGFRYIELDERLTAELIEADVPFSFQTATRNRLYGGQLGAQVLLWDAGGRLTVDADGRTGVFGNAAAQHSRYDFGVVPATDHGSTTPVSFLGEIGVTAGYRLSQRWSAQAGYRLMWINQLALATDGVAASDFLFGGGIDASGDTFYHGATIGLQYIR